MYQPAWSAAFINCSQTAATIDIVTTQVTCIYNKVSIKYLLLKCLITFLISRPGVKLDERSAALIMMKYLPLPLLIQSLYPDMYRVDSLELAKTLVRK